MKDSLVTIRVFDTPTTAAIVKGMHESHGIPAMTTNNDFSSLYPLNNPSISGVPLMVREQDRDRAILLLNEYND